MPGSVSHANWTFSWSVPSLSGEGLVISKAIFNGVGVLFRGGQPFVLVPYHGGSPTFKDGLGATCGGVPYTPLIPTAPNTGGGLLPPGSIATNDNAFDPGTNPGGAVMLEKMPAGLTEPAHATVWAKFQVGNYQYIHEWSFSADGSVDLRIGLGGALWTTNQPVMGHIHNFYIRLDVDLAGSANNLVQRFAHANNNPGQDGWSDIVVEAKQSADPKTFTKWRVVNKTPKVNGQLRSYEALSGSDGAPDGAYSTGDVWIVRYKGSGEDGATVGCTDAVINGYANGESVNGEDVVIWICVRHHHAPRPLGEESLVLPYEFLELRLEPRDILDGTPLGIYATTPPSP